MKPYILLPIVMNMSVSLGLHAVLCVVGQSASSSSKWLLKDLEADGVLRFDGCLVVHHVVVHLSAVQQSYRLAVSTSVVLCMAKCQHDSLAQEALKL